MKKLAVASVFLGLFFILPSFAQEEWDPVSAGPLTTWTAPLCGKGALVAQPLFYYNLTRGTFDDDGKYNKLPDGNKKSQLQEQLLLQYGLTERLEIDGQLVYQQNYAHTSGDSASYKGLGDSYFFGRYCLLEEQDTLPHITGIFQLKIPTGKYQKFDPAKLETDSMGVGAYEPGYGFIFTKKIKPFVFHLDAIYGVPLKTKIDGVKTRYGRYLNYDFGMEYFLPKGFNLLLEFNGLVQGDTRSGGEYTSGSASRYFNLGTGIGWSCDRLQALLCYQRVLTGTNTDANDSAVFTVVHSF